MSVKKKEPSTSEKEMFFCEVCNVACVSKEGLELHNEAERHKRMEECTVGGKKFYKSMEEFIACPRREEPVIGSQYLIQQHPNKHHPKAFLCNTCEKYGTLSHMMKHLKSYRHRLNYMGRHYKDLFPLFKKYTPYYKRELNVREHAKAIERKEASSKVEVPEPQEGVIKNDYFEYIVKRHKELDAWYKKMSVFTEHKEKVLKFMETFTVTSHEEATLVQKLTEDLENAMHAFNLKFNKSQSKEATLSKADHGSEDRKSTDRPGRKGQKRKSPWNDELPNKVPTQTSTHNAVKAPSSERSTSWKDPLTTESLPSISKGFGGETSKSMTTETSEVTPSCDDAFEVNDQTTGNKKEPSQKTPPKREWVCRSKSTGFGYGIWDTLRKSEKSDQNMTSSFTWGSTPTKISQSAFSSSDGNDTKDHVLAKTRRASTDLLSTFSFSISALENCSSLSVPSQSFGKGKMSEGNKDSQNQHRNAEESFIGTCMDSSTQQINQTHRPLHGIEDSVTNSTQHSDEEMDPSQHPDLENSPLHYSDVQSNPEEHIILDEYTDANNDFEYEGSDASPAKHSDLESSPWLDQHADETEALD